MEQQFSLLAESPNDPSVFLWCDEALSPPESPEERLLSDVWHGDVSHIGEDEIDAERILARFPLSIYFKGQWQEYPLMRYLMDLDVHSLPQQMSVSENAVVSAFVASTGGYSHVSDEMIQVLRNAVEGFFQGAATQSLIGSVASSSGFHVALSAERVFAIQEAMCGVHHALTKDGSTVFYVDNYPYHTVDDVLNRMRYLSRDSSTFDSSGVSVRFREFFGREGVTHEDYFRLTALELAEANVLSILLEREIRKAIEAVLMTNPPETIRSRLIRFMSGTRRHIEECERSVDT